MEFAILTGIPMPPSINAAYMNRKGAGPGRIKTGAYRAFENQMAYWAAAHFHQVGEAMRLVETPNTWIRLDVYFCFPHKSLITIKGLPKRHDVDNRLKVLNDAVAKVLRFDDSRISHQSIEKIAIQGLSEPTVTVQIRRSQISTALPYMTMTGAR